VSSWRAVDADFLEGRFEVVLDGVGRDVQPFGDVVVGVEPFGDELDDFALARCEAVGAADDAEDCSYPGGMDRDGKRCLAFPEMRKAARNLRPPGPHGPQPRHTQTPHLRGLFLVGETGI
jgi:hypothetical protein